MDRLAGELGRRALPLILDPSAVAKPSAVTRRPRGRRPAVPTQGLTALDVVGIGHVVLGALALGGALVGVVTSMDTAPLGALVVFGLLALVGGLTALAGLWLRDGQRRGAILAAGLDVARLLLLLLAWPRTSGLDLVLTLALLVGVLWVWPSLPARNAEPPGRPPRA